MADRDIGAQLTAPGAPFELTEKRIAGRKCRVFVDTPGCLATLYGNLDAFADHTLVVYEGRKLTYGEVVKRAAALAQHLREDRELGAGDHVAIAMRNCPEWIIAFLAITSLGGVAVLVNSRGTADEIGFCLTSTDCRLVIADARCAGGLVETDAANIPRIELDPPSHPGEETPLAAYVRQAPNASLPGVERDPEDAALILFTSGTTGQPKGAVLTHRGVLTALKTNQYSSALIGAQMAARYGVDLETLAANRPQLCTLLMFPLFHVSGCHSVLLPSLVQGGKIVLMRRWDPRRALQLVESEKITSFPGVPTMHWDLLQVSDRDRYDVSSLTSISVGGQGTPVPLMEAVQKAFPGAILGTGYGMTETNGAVTLSVGEDLLGEPASAGRVVATMDVRIRDDDGRSAERGDAGEICIRGATVMTEYYDHPDANAESFQGEWFRTGDVGYLDDSGRLFIVDRHTDMVISGGENIYCAEVERILLQHSDVLEATTFGVPDERLGEALVAIVRPREGGDITESQLEAFAGQQLAAFKVPTAITLTREPLPRNASGKVMKRQVRDAYVQGASA